MQDLVRPGLPERLLMVAFGLPFAAIGAGVIFVSLFVFGGVASFGALFGLPFFGIGALFVWSGISGRSPAGGTERFEAIARMSRAARQHRQAEAPMSPGTLDLSCSQCGATVNDESEISPSGDVKCTHCGTWFNVRG